MRNLGIVSYISFWVFTLISMITNCDWYKISQHTLSKLGRPGLAHNPWLFSIGLAVSGAMMLIYGINICRRCGKKWVCFGGALITLSGAFMILLGPLYDGKPAHDLIALCVFYLVYVGSLVVTFEFGRKEKLFGFVVLVAAIAGNMLTIWPALTYLEIYGLFLILLDLMMLRKIIQ